MKNLMLVRGTAAAAALMIAAGAALPVFAAVPVSAAGPDGARGARSVQEMGRQTMNSVYLLPDSDTYYISESDISWMDDEELMLARNEFYARRGRKFVTTSIRDYFNRQSWYNGYIEPDDFSTDVFNRYEQANVNFIVAYEKQRAQQRAGKASKKNNKKASARNISEVRYQGVRERYENYFLESREEDEDDGYGVNRLAQSLGDAGDLGYAYLDLDGDGEDEFLIGPTDTRAYGEGAVFAIYTIEDGNPVEVAAGDENSIYYICGDGMISRELNYEDGSWEIDYYELEDGELAPRNVLIMDEEEDSEEPDEESGEETDEKDGGLLVSEGNVSNPEGTMSDRTGDGQGAGVVFFYFSSNGSVNVRREEDYVSRMIGMAGGRYLLHELVEKRLVKLILKIWAWALNHVWASFH